VEFVYFVQQILGNIIMYLLLLFSREGSVWEMTGSGSDFSTSDSDWSIRPHIQGNIGDKEAGA
jgi:hypothetical protein